MRKSYILTDLPTFKIRFLIRMYYVISTLFCDFPADDGVLLSLLCRFRLRDEIKVKKAFLRTIDPSLLRCIPDWSFSLNSLLVTCSPFEHSSLYVFNNVSLSFLSVKLQFKSLDNLMRWSLMVSDLCWYSLVLSRGRILEITTLLVATF